MEERNIAVTLDKAKEWYQSGSATLKEIALQAFNENELIYNFKKITTFKDACTALGLNYYYISAITKEVALTSKASVAMFKLNIVRKALNLGYNLSLTKGPKDYRIYYPYNPFITESSTCYKGELYSGEIEIIGKIKSGGTLYKVLGYAAFHGSSTGLGRFNFSSGVGYGDGDVGFLGCASYKIAKHFSKYFGMLITEAKYADMVDFEIIEDKYGNAKK